MLSKVHTHIQCDCHHFCETFSHSEDHLTNLWYYPPKLKGLLATVIGTSHHGLGEDELIDGLFISSEDLGLMQCFQKENAL